MHEHNWDTMRSQDHYHCALYPLIFSIIQASSHLLRSVQSLPRDCQGIVTGPMQGLKRVGMASHQPSRCLFSAYIHCFSLPLAHRTSTPTRSSGPLNSKDFSLFLSRHGYTTAGCRDASHATRLAVQSGSPDSSGSGQSSTFCFVSYSCKMGEFPS